MTNRSNPSSTSVLTPQRKTRASDSAYEGPKSDLDPTTVAPRGPRFRHLLTILERLEHLPPMVDTLHNLNASSPAVDHAIITSQAAPIDMLNVVVGATVRKAGLLMEHSTWILDLARSMGAVGLTEQIMTAIAGVIGGLFVVRCCTNFEIGLMSGWLLIMVVVAHGCLLIITVDETRLCRTFTINYA